MGYTHILILKQVCRLWKLLSALKLYQATSCHDVSNETLYLFSTIREVHGQLVMVQPLGFHWEKAGKGTSSQPWLTMVGQSTMDMVNYGWPVNHG